MSWQTSDCSHRVLMPVIQQTILSQQTRADQARPFSEVYSQYQTCEQRMSQSTQTQILLLFMH